jgi:hypothetical protein
MILRQFLRNGLHTRARTIGPVRSVVAG